MSDLDLWEGKAGLALAADLMNLYASLREEYLPPRLRVGGAFNDSSTSRSEQHLMIEIAAFRQAAEILRSPHETPVSLPSWKWDEWESRVATLLRPPASAPPG